MSDLIKIAVDAMGGDGSPKKIIDGIILNSKSNKNVFYKIFIDDDSPMNASNRSIDGSIGRRRPSWRRSGSKISARCRGRRNFGELVG